MAPKRKASTAITRSSTRLSVIPSSSNNSNNNSNKKKKLSPTTTTTTTTTTKAPFSPTKANWADVRNGDDMTCIPGPEATISNKTASLPTRRKDGRLVFKDYPTFQPNKTPQEVIQEGSFGGCYFRPIKSSVCNDPKLLKNQHLEFDFFEDISDDLLCKKQYDASVNKYKVSCGGSLQMWQSKGWISSIDPYGWFQWYCRFYSGRRSTDDERQIGRWERCTGPKGRWKNNLLTKIVNSSGTLTLDKYSDPTISPVVRQTLLHWGYEVTKKDLEQKVKEMNLK